MHRWRPKPGKWPPSAAFCIFFFSAFPQGGIYKFPLLVFEFFRDHFGSSIGLSHRLSKGTLLPRRGAFFIMVVAGRLAWARRLIAQGTPAHISVGSAAALDRGKAKLVIEHAGAPTSPMARALLIDTLDSLAWRASIVRTVDRGHKHSTGSSEICIWFTALPTQAHAASDGADDDGNTGGGGPSRPRRGRSPPDAPDGNDPWHGTGSSDPWAARSVFPAFPAQKAPRRKILGPIHEFSWANWRGYTASPSAQFAAASSVTPEPPMTQHRCSRTLPPVRTGTPPLSQALGSDGLFVATGTWTPIGSRDTWKDDIDENLLNAFANMARFVTVSGADAFDGKSLVNIALERREADTAIVRNAKLVTESAKHSPPHIFSEGEIVYLAGDDCPYTVKRIGFGQYLEEVRIIRFGEVDSYAAGRWVHHGRLYNFRECARSCIDSWTLNAQQDSKLRAGAGTSARK